MSTASQPHGLHRGRSVLGAVMVLLAVAVLLQEVGAVTLQLRYLAPALLVLAGIVLLVSGSTRSSRSQE